LHYTVDAQKPSPIIDIAAARFNIELELEEKADFKIKAKQFVKIYGQMASIMPNEIAAWEKLFWFLKFLIPKLIALDPNADLIDELLNSVNLSSYVLQCVKLNHSISLDGNETEVDPRNINPRGAHGDNEEQRIKFVNIADNIKAHPDFEEKYKNNQDVHNRKLTIQKIFEEVMLKNIVKNRIYINY